MNYSWKITKVEWNNDIRCWWVELDNGLIRVTTKFKPDYKVGDFIVELPHFYHYIDALQ